LDDAPIRLDDEDIEVRERFVKASRTVERENEAALQDADDLFFRF